MPRTRSKTGEMARALLNRSEWTSEQIGEIRRLLRSGGTPMDVHKLHPNLAYATVRKRLKRLGILPVNSLSHRGYDTAFTGERIDLRDASAVIAGKE